jgi:hypothetical protein
MVDFDKIVDLKETEHNPIVSDKVPPVKGIGETKTHRLVLEYLEIMRQSEAIVPCKTVPMRGLFDELLYSFNAMTSE